MASAKNLLSSCVAWSLVLAFAAPALPQEPAGQGQVIRKQVDLVNLFATVRDNHKKIVGNLKQEDFKILEDNQAQKIAFFSREVTLPITLALLLDTSGSEQYMLSAIQDAGGRFLDRVLRKGDEALVMQYSFRRRCDQSGPDSDAANHRNGAVRRNLSGVQRKIEHGGRTQSHRDRDGRARRRQ